jgi:hypothetical protein
MAASKKTALSGAAPLGIDTAFREVDLLTASRAGVLPIKLIREDLFLLATAGAFAFKGLQVFELLVTGAVLWCGHRIPPK